MTGSETINSGRDFLKTVRQSLSFKTGPGSGADLSSGGARLYLLLGLPPRKARF